MDYNIESVQTILSVMMPALIGLIAAYLGAKWQTAKQKLTEVRQLIDTVDDALQDDKVTEEEFREIFQKLKDLQ